MNRSFRNKLVRNLLAWLDSREWVRFTFGSRPRLAGNWPI